MGVDMRTAAPAILFGLAATLSGCVTTAPGTGASFAYHLPRTDLEVAYDLKLTACEANGFRVTATIVPSLVAGAQDALYEVNGGALASARIKRDVKISVNGDGVITAINTTSEDKTLSIIGDVVKAAATLAPVVVGAGRSTGPSQLPCTDAVLDALDRVQTIRGQIKDLRATLAKLPATAAGAAKGRDLVKDVDALAAELAATTTGDGVLAVHAKGKITLAGDAAAPVRSGTVGFDASAFDKWFGAAKPGKEQQRKQLIEQYFGLGWDATIQAAQPPAGTTLPTRKLRTCGLALTVPGVVDASVNLAGTGNSVKGVKGKQSAPVAQWAEPRSLCIDVAVGETRTVSLTFDNFGRTTEYNWSSNAQGASFSSAIAGASGDVMSLRKTLTGKTEDEIRAEKLASLKTRKDLNVLEACQAIIEAGGFNCPAAAAQ